MTPNEALKNIRTLVEASGSLQDDRHRKMLLKCVVVAAQKGLGVAPNGEAEYADNVLMFPARQSS